MFSFIRWIKELSLDISLDDLSACEGYPSLQAVEKLVKARAAFAAGKPSVEPSRSLPMGGVPEGGVVVPLSSAAASRAHETTVGDAKPSRLRSAG